MALHLHYSGRFNVEPDPAPLGYRVGAYGTCTRVHCDMQPEYRLWARASARVDRLLRSAQVAGREDVALGHQDGADHA